MATALTGHLTVEEVIEARLKGSYSFFTRRGEDIKHFRIELDEIKISKWSDDEFQIVQVFKNSEYDQAVKWFNSWFMGSYGRE
jgi:hypothetical protein